MYAPQPGTLPARVLQHLRSLPAGSQLTTHVLADALGSDTAFGIPEMLGPAVLAGAVKQEKQRGTGHILWSLGDGQPLPIPLETDEPDGTRRAGRKKAPEPAPAAPTEQEATQALVEPFRQLRDVMTEPPQPPQPVRQAAPRSLSAIVPPPPAPFVSSISRTFRYAIYSDGEVVIENSGMRVRLSPAEADSLSRALLKRLGEAAA